MAEQKTQMRVGGGGEGFDEDDDVGLGVVAFGLLSFLLIFLAVDRRFI